VVNLDRQQPRVPAMYISCLSLWRLDQCPTENQFQWQIPSSVLQQTLEIGRFKQNTRLPRYCCRVNVRRHVRSKTVGVFFGFPRDSFLSPHNIPPSNSRTAPDQYLPNSNKIPAESINHFMYYVVFLISTPHGARRKPP